MSNARVFTVPATNLMGRGCLNEVGPYIQELGLNKALVVTDKFLNQNGIAGKVLDQLTAVGVDFVVYDDVKPNPTTKNVHDGVAVYNENNCNFIVSVGGGSPQDAAKGIGLVITNGGDRTKNNKLS